MHPSYQNACWHVCANINQVSSGLVLRRENPRLSRTRPAPKSAALIVTITRVSRLCISFHAENVSQALTRLAVTSSTAIALALSDCDLDLAATSNQAAVKHRVLIAAAQVRNRSDVFVQASHATHTANPMGAALRTIATPRKKQAAARIKTRAKAMFSAGGDADGVRSPRQHLSRRSNARRLRSPLWSPVPNSVHRSCRAYRLEGVIRQHPKYDSPTMWEAYGPRCRVPVSAQRQHR